MAQVLVRGLSDAVVARLKRRARALAMLLKCPLVTADNRGFTGLRDSSLSRHVRHVTEL